MPDKIQEPLQSHELIAAFIETRLSNNLAAFKEHLPDIYQAFSQYKEERFFLIYDQDGNINLFDKEKECTLYNGNPVQQCLDNLSAYIKEPIQRPYFIAGNKSGKKDLVNYLHSSALSAIGGCQTDAIGRITESLLKRALGSESIYEMEAENSVEQDFTGELPSFVNTLFCFSSGLGFDVETLYLERDIKHLFVIEPNSDIFYASLQLIDWSTILDKSVDKSYPIRFVIDDNFKEIIASVSSGVHGFGRHNVAGAYIYSSFFLPEYSELFEELKNTISYSYLSGFGFYDDSRYSLAHTLGNVKNNVPLLASNKDISKNLGQDQLPVMIIGNGPSLDASIDYIRDNQDKFVVVSCGTALRALIKNDIQPDFHVELERTAHVPYWIKWSEKGIDGFFDKLKKITLIEVSQVHPDTASLFGKAGMLLKDIETGSSLFHYNSKASGAALLPRLAPSAVHTAVTACAILGFRSLYFFGVDMGTVDPTRHHSKDSSYQYASEEYENRISINKKSECYKSNFGEKEVYSSGFYPMFKRELEAIVAGWKYTFQNKIDFYNCSDGALLDGVEPLGADSIACPDVDVYSNKEDIIDQVFNAFFSFYPEEEYKTIFQSLDVIKDVVDESCDSAISFIKPIKTIQNAFELTDQFAGKFHSSDVLSDKYAWLYSIYDGSLLYILSTINSTAMLPVSDDIKIKALNEQFDYLKQFFLDIKEDFRENCLKWDEESRYSLLEEKEA